MFPEVNEFGFYANGFEMIVKPVGHLDDIWAACCIATYAVDDDVDDRSLGMGGRCVKETT
jgi:hypothetical protein